MSELYQFNSTVFDPKEGTLSVDGVDINITPRLIAVLSVLIESGGRIVDRAELLSAAWGGANVEAANVNFAIHQLRKVLGDSSETPKYIATVPRMGFRFIPEVKRIHRDDLHKSNPPSGSVSDSSNAAPRLPRSRSHKIFLWFSRLTAEFRATSLPYQLFFGAATLVSFSILIFGLSKYLTDRRGDQDPQPFLTIQGPSDIGSVFLPGLIDEFLKREGYPNQQFDRVTSKMPMKAKRPDQTYPVVCTYETSRIEVAVNSLQRGNINVVLSTEQIPSIADHGIDDLNQNNPNPLREYVIGLYGFSIIVNGSNPTRSISKQQAHKIFTGAIRNWSEISPTISGEIKVYIPSRDEADFDLRQALDEDLLEGTQPAEQAKPTAGFAMSNSVAGEERAIGFLDSSSIGNTRPLEVYDLNNQSLLPTETTLSTEDYLFSNRIYLYILDNAPSYVRKFAEFAISPEGQAQMNGYRGLAGQKVIPVVSSFSSAASAEYRRLVSNTHRLSLTFRFRGASYELDSKALADIERILDSEMISKRIILASFTNRMADRASEEREAAQLASKVVLQFENRGVRPSIVRSFGASALLVSADSRMAAQKNRRVEIWITD